MHEKIRLLIKEGQKNGKMITHSQETAFKLM